MRFSNMNERVAKLSFARPSRRRAFLARCAAGLTATLAVGAGRTVAAQDITTQELDAIKRSRMEEYRQRVDALPAELRTWLGRAGQVPPQGLNPLNANHSQIK